MFSKLNLLLNLTAFGSACSTGCLCKLLLSSYKVLWYNSNLADNQFYNHLLDHLQSFEYHIFSSHCLLSDQKFFLLIIIYFVIFPVGSLYFACDVLSVAFLNSKAKNLLTLWKLGSVRKSKYWVCTCVVTLIRSFCQVIMRLNTASNFVRSFWTIFSW